MHEEMKTDEGSRSHDCRVSEILELIRALTSGNLEARGIPAGQDDDLDGIIAGLNRLAEDLASFTVYRDYLDDILRSMLDGLIVVSADGTIQTINEAACRLLGYREDELLARPIESVFPMEGESPFDDAGLEELKRKGFIYNMTQNIRTKNGKIIQALFSASPMKDGRGGVGGIVCIVRDMREINSLVALLGERTRELESFAYTVSHDLKAPLVTLEGFSSILVRYYGDRLDEKGRYYLERIQHNTEHMGKLIGDLLDFSRVGRITREWSPVNVERLLREIKTELATQPERKNIEFTVHAPLPEPFGDPMNIRQLFVNLIGNAVKFSGEREDPRIEIGCEKQENGFYEFYVRDNGIGIAEEYHERIFRIFERLGDIEAEGTGVGLAIVKKILDYHGGCIRVESARDQGTAFYFTLPQKAGEDFGVSD